MPGAAGWRDHRGCRDVRHVGSRPPAGHVARRRGSGALPVMASRPGGPRLGASHIRQTESRQYKQHERGRGPRRTAGVAWGRIARAVGDGRVGVAACAGRLVAAVLPLRAATTTATHIAPPRPRGRSACWSHSAPAPREPRRSPLAAFTRLTASPTLTRRSSTSIPRLARAGPPPEPAWCSRHPGRCSPTTT